MAEKTLHEERMSRADVATQLRRLADELDSGEDEGEDGGTEGAGGIEVPVGNKRVRLTPPEEIGYEIGVREGSSVLRGNRETVSLTLDWKPR
ncbi:amphi-Trp domain-containing protein [Halalkalicoccus tibetensis]|uniref:Amphi-Trp domain-containing protein n=1 Tax=Halalkalicoccus tibetensis TaxID=175632 RepID=A0ABD5V3I9_9EURY